MASNIGPFREVASFCIMLLQMMAIVERPRVAILAGVAGAQTVEMSW